MVGTPLFLSFEEYLNYDDESDRPSELVAGRLEVMPPASDLHEAIIAFLFVRFYLEIQKLNLDWVARSSGTGVRTASDRCRLPDVVVFTQQQRQEIRGKSAVLTSAPLLVVEVVSLGEEQIDRDYRQKRTEYEAIALRSTGLGVIA